MFGLTSGGSIDMTSSVQNTQTFNVGLTLQPGSYSFLNDSSAAAALVFTGSISASASGSTGDSLTLGGGNTGANLISGTLSDGSTASSLSLVKTGTGTWTLSGGNTYSGTTTINGGTLRLGGPGSVSSNGGSVIVNAGGVLAAGGNAAITGAGTLNLDGGTVQVLNSDLNTTVGTTLVGTTESYINTGGLNATFSGSITGTGDLDKTGTGNLTLANIASTGRLYIDQGSVVSSGANNSVDYLRAVNGGTVGLTVNPATVFTLNGTTAANPPSTGRVIGGTTLNLVNNGQINVTYGTFAVGLSGLGAGTLNLSGSGTLDLDRVTSGTYAGLYTGYGAGTVGTVVQSASSVVNTGGVFLLGVDSGNGTYQLTNNSILKSGTNWSAPHYYIGLNQSAGQSGTMGTLTISDSSRFELNANSYLDVGTNLGGSGAVGGTGTITQSGAGSVVSLDGSFAAFGSQGAGGTGTYNLAAGTLDFGAGTVLFGANAGATGVLNQSGGVLTAETGVAVGSGGTGTYNLSGGTATFSAGLSVGAAGLVNQTGGSATLAGSTLSLANQNAGYELNGGTLNVGAGAAVQIDSSKLRVGDGAGSNGTLNLAAGGSISLDASNNLAYLSIGRSGGTGTFNMSGGTVNAVSTSANGFSIFFVGATGATGTVNQSGGSVTSAATTIIGADLAKGVYNLSGSALLQSPDNSSDAGSHVYIGLNQDTTGTAATSGTLNVGGSASFTMRSGSYLDVGTNLGGSGAVGGTGTITQSGAGSVVSLDGSFAAFGSQGAGGTGTYNLAAGTLDFGAGTVLFGANAGATGVLNQSGGVLTAETGVAVGSGGTGTYNLSGGTATFSAGLSVGAASGSTGTVTETGGFLTVGGGGLVLGSGSYNLQGGTLAIGSLTSGGSPSTFNFNGGKLQATASGTGFFQGLSTANVQTGGAIIDTQSNSVTIAQALLHDTSSGAPGTDGGLTKLGLGALTLTGINTFLGPVTIDAGTLTVASEANLGDGSLVTVNGGGQLLFTGSATLTRTYDLGISKLSVGSGNTLTLNGATINGGFVGGPGVDALGNGATLNAVTTLSNSTLTQTGGTAALNLSTVRGAITQGTGATLNVADTTVTSAGTLTVGGTVNTSGVEIDGVANINGGGTVANSGTSIVFGGGARTTINAGGVLSTDSASTIELNGALLVNNGTQSGTLDVNYGSTASGSGTFGNVNVNPGGKFGSSSVNSGNNEGFSALRLTGGGGLAATAPLVGPQFNASPGTTNVGSLTLHGGGIFSIRVQNATGAAGSGYDLTHASGALTLASDASPSNQIVIELSSLNANGSPGAAANFNPSQNYQFVLVQADGGIVGYTSSAEFDVDSSGFANALNGGSFSVVEEGNELVLDFSTSVPEPGTWTMGILCAAFVGTTIWRSSRRMRVVRI